MLQLDKSPSLADRGPAAQEFVSPAELFAALLGFLRRQFQVILSVLLLTVAAGAVYLFTATPKFTAQASMIIDTRKVQLFQQQSVLGDVPVDSAAVETQVEIIKSENVALAVVKDLRLIHDPEFVGGGGGLLGAVLGFIPSLFASAPEPVSEADLTRRAVAVLQSRMTVKRVGLTYVIDIAFQSLDRDRAAQVANAVADAYIVDTLEAKYQTTRRAAVWLQDRLKELRQEASSAERAVVDFKQKNNIVDTGGRLLNEQQLAELNSALIQARAQTAEAKARLERIDDIIKINSPEATVTDTLRSDVISKLRSQYLDYSGKAADWSRRFGPNHLAAVNLRNQMREIARSIRLELGRIAETYKSEFEIATAREESVQKSLTQIVSESQTTNQAQIALRELESSAQTYRALYDNFLQRYMESVQQQSFPITEARVITQASRPTGKSAPKSTLVLALSIAGGMLLGIGLGVLRDISDRVFRTGRQVETLLQIDCIAVLPKLQTETKDIATGRKPAPAPSSSRTIVRDQSLLWHVIDSPFSRFAEGVRSVKVATDVSAVTKSNRVIGITSALPNEGKSTVAAAFAQLMAHGGARVVLVDCDLRNPSLTRSLAPAATHGLLEVIEGVASLESVIWTDADTHLTFLPAVFKSRLPHTAEILSSEPMRKLFDSLRDRYDYVVVDLSPLSPVVDVRATTQLVDSFVFVIEWGRTSIDAVEHALSAARGVYESLLGVVLNKANMNVLGRYEAYRGNYYYNRYYSRYGYTE